MHKNHFLTTAEFLAQLQTIREQAEFLDAFANFIITKTIFDISNVLNQKIDIPDNYIQSFSQFKGQKHMTDDVAIKFVEELILQYMQEHSPAELNYENVEMDSEKLCFLIQLQCLENNLKIHRYRLVNSFILNQDQDVCYDLLKDGRRELIKVSYDTAYQWLLMHMNNYDLYITENVFKPEIGKQFRQKHNQMEASFTKDRDPQYSYGPGEYKSEFSLW